MEKLSAFAVLYQNEEMMVINKPFDVAMDGDHEVTVEKWVHNAQKDFMEKPLPTGNLSHHGGSNGVSEKRLKFVHQLDYATSGVLCLAFSKDMASRLAHCFQMRYTRKEYLALVYGHVKPDELLSDNRSAPISPQSGGVHPLLSPASPSAAVTCDSSFCVDAPIGVDTEDPQGFRMKIDPQQGRSAVTKVCIMSRGHLLGFPDVAVTKLLLLPESGRRHQLRVHLSSIGHPIVGDASYAMDLIRSHLTPPVSQPDSDFGDATASVRSAPHRMMLHAWRLRMGEDVTRVVSQSHKDRVEAKKKRRRETLALEIRGKYAVMGDQPDDGVCGDDAVAEQEAAASGSLFVTEDPFKDFIV